MFLIMCGIYCCLKCNKSDASNGNSRGDSVLHKFVEYLKHRGPDGFSEYKTNIGSKWSAYFAGSVLWMQGSEVTVQPLIDDEHNLLLWNGDVFNGSMVRT
jgi:asparagine synthetase B (glutamine-hydrolysing)